MRKNTPDFFKKCGKNIFSHNMRENVLFDKKNLMQKSCFFDRVLQNSYLCNKDRIEPLFTLVSKSSLVMTRVQKTSDFRHEMHTKFYAKRFSIMACEKN